MGGIRFAGVAGAPERPWKLDKNNYQFRVGTTYSLNDKTVLRAGYGKYFLNPTSQGNNAGFSQSTTLIASTDGGRTPTYALSNPWPDGIQQPPGSSLGPLTFLGRGPDFSNPDFVVPNVHQFSVGIQRELPWRISLEATYAGSRSYDLIALDAQMVVRNAEGERLIAARNFFIGPWLDITRMTMLQPGE